VNVQTHARSDKKTVFFKFKTLLVAQSIILTKISGINRTTNELEYCKPNKKVCRNMVVLEEYCFFFEESATVAMKGALTFKTYF